jgi:hypothetical protein
MHQDDRILGGSRLPILLERIGLVFFWEIHNVELNLGKKLQEQEL